MILSLKKIKENYDGNQRRIETLMKENEMLKDKSGIDLTQLTPRPQWKPLLERYNLSSLVDTRKNFLRFLNQRISEHMFDTGKGFDEVWGSWKQ